MQDKRILELEGKLEGIKELNNILRVKLEGMPGNSTDPTYIRGTSPGKRVWEELISPRGSDIRRSRTHVGLPIAISFQSSHISLTSILPRNPGSDIRVMLHSQHEESGALLDPRDVSQGLIRHSVLPTSTNLMSEGFQLTPTRGHCLAAYTLSTVALEPPHTQLNPKWHPFASSCHGRDCWTDGRLYIYTLLDLGRSTR